MRNMIGVVVVATLLSGLSACDQKTQEAAKPVALFKPTATIQEIMTSIIDPNIDFVWNSTAVINTATGTEERKPHTDEDWLAVRQHALVVLEASNLLLIEGRSVAAKGATTSTKNSAEASPEEIKRTIDAKRADFIAYAHALHDAVEQTIVAIDAKDATRLDNAGGAIDQVCEKCHKEFWYPKDKRPGDKS